MTSSKDPVFNNGKTETTGTKEFAVNFTKASDSKMNGVTLTVRLALGANWIKYSSNTSSKYDVKANEEKSISIYTLDKVWPQRRKIWFTKVNEPTLYAYILWERKNDIGYVEKCYTYLSYDYNEYKQVAKSN